MLGLAIIALIGGLFYDLAKKHQKNKWLFAIAGLASYFLGSALVTLIFSVSISGRSYNLVHTVISVLIGFFGCYLFYIALKNRWEENQVTSDTAILDDEFVAN